MIYSRRKKLRSAPKMAENPRLFDGLPDDLVITILCKLSSSASCPLDFINILLTCKRLNRLALHPIVLSKSGPKALAVKAKNWSESAHRFLKLCVNAGNVEAHYILGMIRFYCLHSPKGGASLMAKAAIKSHLPALYSLAVIQFNGSGGTKTKKDLRAGVELCARAAVLGHTDALRELGHCLQDGYGVRQSLANGRRLLIQANARELATTLRAASPQLRSLMTCLTLHHHNHCHRHQTQSDDRRSYSCVCLSLLSDFGCDVGAPEVHPANRFLIEWFGSGQGGLGDGLKLCSHVWCGRPETRAHEFRRCSACGTVNYCSRGCQAIDWKARHKTECLPIGQWLAGDGGGRNGGGGGGGQEMAEHVPVNDLD